MLTYALPISRAQSAVRVHRLGMVVALIFGHSTPVLLYVIVLYNSPSLVVVVAAALGLIG
jgi:hypothetical protein